MYLKPATTTIITYPLRLTKQIRSITLSQTLTPYLSTLLPHPTCFPLAQKHPQKFHLESNNILTQPFKNKPLKLKLYSNVSRTPLCFPLTHHMTSIIIIIIVMSTITEFLTALPTQTMTMMVPTLNLATILNEEPCNDQQRTLTKTILLTIMWLII